MLSILPLLLPLLLLLVGAAVLRLGQAENRGLCECER